MSEQKYPISQQVFDVMVAKLAATGSWTEEQARADMLETFTVYEEAEITTRDVVRFYYRSKAQGSKVTLRAAAARFGLSYEAVRKRKQRYDSDGEWGSMRSRKQRGK